MKSARVGLILLCSMLFHSCSIFQKKLDDAKGAESKPSSNAVVLTSASDEVDLASDISGLRTALDKNSIQQPATAFVGKDSGASNTPDALAKNNSAEQTPDAAHLGTNVEKSKNLSESITSPSAERKIKELGSSKQTNKKSSKNEFYKVKNGDTLMKISFEKYGNIFRWRDIYNKNRDKISNYNRLTTGTVLLIEGVEYVVLVKSGKPYLIRRSDTLRKISKHLYGTEQGWKALWDHNRDLIIDPNKIYAGLTLYYTDKPQTAPAPDSLALGTEKATSADQRKPANVNHK